MLPSLPARALEGPVPSAAVQTVRRGEGVGTSQGGGTSIDITLQLLARTLYWIRQTKCYTKGGSPVSGFVAIRHNYTITIIMETTNHEIMLGFEKKTLGVEHNYENTRTIFLCLRRGTSTRKQNAMNNNIHAITHQPDNSCPALSSKCSSSMASYWSR